MIAALCVCGTLDCMAANADAQTVPRVESTDPATTNASKNPPGAAPSGEGVAQPTESDELLRRRLLAPVQEKLKRIVFTKHFDMGGSHYAYTDAVSNEDTLNPTGVVKEFNYKAGSSLCLLELDANLSAKETILLQDKDGVFRDPDVSYDGKRILFAWKKSARGDDYHLYEMDVETRQVRQLTSGLGVADYEGVYLPDGNIMFSSSRCFQNVD